MVLRSLACVKSGWVSLMETRNVREKYMRQSVSSVLGILTLGRSGVEDWEAPRHRNLELGERSKADLHI